MKKKQMNLRRLSFGKEVIVALNTKEQALAVGGGTLGQTDCQQCVYSIQLSNCPPCLGSAPRQSHCPVSVEPCGICL